MMQKMDRMESLREAYGKEEFYQSIFKVVLYKLSLLISRFPLTGIMVKKDIADSNPSMYLFMHLSFHYFVYTFILSLLNSWFYYRHCIW